MANGVNNSRTVVGMDSNGTAFSLAGGSLTTLPDVNGTTTSETAFGINDGGLIACNTPTARQARRRSSC